MFCPRCGTNVGDQAKFCPSCGMDLSSTTPVAAVREEANETDIVRDALKNEYEVIQELGRGGMAIVFKAREKALDREVAVKVLPFSLAYDQEFVERFQREARTAAKLEHPHIIPIYRVGKSGRVIYFVMKFLRGKSLSETLEERGALPPEDIRRLLIQTVGALGYAHKNGIVHRDIKPDNIMFDESGNAIVTDFGIAKAASGTRLTGTGMSIGTPHYMSPEQARAQPLDGRSDIYSLGVVAYQCLTGGVPFDGEDSFSIGYKHIMEELPAPELSSAEQRAVFEIVRKMMAKSPDERFQSGDELVAALEGRAPTPVARPVGADAPTTVLPSAALATARGGAPVTPTTPVPRAEPRPEAPKKKKRRGAVLVGMFTLLLVGGGGAGYWLLVMGPGAAGRSGTALASSGLPTPPAGPAAGGVATQEPVVAPPDTATVDSARGAVTAPPAELPNEGWIRLAGLVRGARVSVDGRATGDNPVAVAPGSRKVKVVAAGYEPFETVVTVPRGDTVAPRITLSRRQQVAPQPPVRQAEPTRQTPAPQPREETPPPPPAQPLDYCSRPGPDYNKDRSCYDRAPSLQNVTPILDTPEGVQGRPTPAVIWVQVGVDGKAKSVAPAQPSSETRFTVAAMRFAQAAQYSPAVKGGSPVEGWFRLAVAARSRR